jgi:rare lipoprotein A
MHYRNVDPSHLPSFPARLGNGAASNNLEDITHTCVQCGMVLVSTRGRSPTPSRTGSDRRALFNCSYPGDLPRAGLALLRRGRVHRHPAGRWRSSTATVLGVVEREHGDGNSGIASVYSDTRTASGEAMIAGAMTAAHRTLPFGTRVTVTNRHNGRAVLVQITDRGPFVRGRVIDLSPAAGRLLGIDGLASVSLAVVSHGEKRSLDQATCRVRRRISRAMRAR